MKKGGYNEKNSYNSNIQWENILKIKIEQEILMYRYLCNGLKKKELKKLNNSQKFETYRSWSNHITKLVDCLKKEQRNEFDRYLNEKVRSYQSYNTLFNSFIPPFIISLFVSLIGEEMIQRIPFIIKSEYDMFIKIIAFIPLCAFALIALSFIMNKMIKQNKATMYEKHFYMDVAEIIKQKNNI